MIAYRTSGTLASLMLAGTLAGCAPKTPEATDPYRQLASNPRGLYEEFVHRSNAILSSPDTSAPKKGEALEAETSAVSRYIKTSLPYPSDFTTIKWDVALLDARDAVKNRIEPLKRDSDYAVGGGTACMIFGIILIIAFEECEEKAKRNSNSIKHLPRAPFVFSLALAVTFGGPYLAFSLAERDTSPKPPIHVTLEPKPNDRLLINLKPAQKQDAQ